jgi:sterol desaturase/sphingolipid hydroxylase (fatty acid hydroxylase superfamily)
MARTYVTLPSPNIPKEQKGNVIYGTFLHLGLPITYPIAMALIGMTPWNALWVFLALSMVFLVFTLLAEKYDASLALPKPTLKEIWLGMVVVFFKGVAVGGSFVALGSWALSHVPLWGSVGHNWWLIVAGTFLTDFAYYLIHRLMSHSKGNNRLLKYYRKKHAAHHSVSELDFLRGNQSSLVDTALSQFQPSLIVISWLLGLDLTASLVVYFLILALQATDHTSVTFNIGWLKYIFMDNHAHKLHHCKRGNLINHAAAFSIYDRLFGTYYEDWNLSSNYLHHHRMPLPIKPAPKKGVAAPQEAIA